MGIYNMADFRFLCRLLATSMTFIQVSSTAHQFTGNDVNGQTLENTNGVGGIKCGNEVFRCGLDAICVGDKCQCPPLTTGDPFVKCVSNDYFVTQVTGDPKVYPYDQGTFHLNLPCRISMTRVVTTHNLGTMGGKCYLDAHIINYFYNDEYYTLGYDLKGTITDNTNPDYSGHFTLRMFGYGHNNGTFVFKVQGNPNSIHHVVHMGAPDRFHYMDTMVQSGYDLVHNIATVTVDACGMATAFKPKVKHSNQKSGFTVSISKANAPRFDSSRYPISGSPHANGLLIMRVKQSLSLTRMQAGLFLALSQHTSQDFGGPSFTCYVASRETTLLCDTPRKLAFGIRLCGFIYIDKRVPKCLQANAFGESNGSLYSMCIQAVCLFHEPLCRMVKQQLKNYKCPKGVEFQRLKCRAIKRHMKRLYPNKIKLP